MQLHRILKGLILILGIFLIIFFIGAKIVSRIMGRWGMAMPCPASLSWVVDNPLRIGYMHSVLDWVGIRPGETVLELGPGPGVFTLDAARYVGDGLLISVDIQPEMINQVTRRLQAAGVDNVQTHVASAYELPISDNSVDRVFLISVLDEIPDPSLALIEFHRVLKPSGILSLTHEFVDPDYLFPGETIKLVEPFGFRKTEQFGNWWLHTINFMKEDK